MLSYMCGFVCFFNMQDFYLEFFTRLQEYGSSIAVSAVDLLRGFYSLVPKTVRAWCKKKKKKKAGLGKELKIKMKLISQKRQNGVFWFLSTSWALLEGLGCKQPPDILLSQEVTSIFLTSSESGSPKHGAVTLLAVGVTAMLCHG